MAQGTVFEKSQRFSAFGNAESYTEFFVSTTSESFSSLQLPSFHKFPNCVLVRICWNIVYEQVQHIIKYPQILRIFVLPLPISPIQSSTPSDTKISHPPRTYIKFPCLQDIEKGHLFTFPRTISCEVQFLELGPPRFQETFGEPASDEVLGRELRKGVSLRGTAPRGALKRGGFWVVKAVSASRRGWLYVSPRIGFLRILGLGQIGGGGRGVL